MEKPRYRWMTLQTLPPMMARCGCKPDHVVRFADIWKFRKAVSKTEPFDTADIKAWGEVVSSSLQDLNIEFSLLRVELTQKNRRIHEGAMFIEAVVQIFQD